jgi:isopentenyl-diphosphate delta-isomerase
LLTDRKNQHLDVVLGGRGRGLARTGFDQIVFEHAALPELDMDAIDLTTWFLGKRINAPLLVSSMTGGPARAAQINENLAIACNELNIALAVGSQRVAIEGPDGAGLDANLRRLAPNIPLLANFGAAQLNLGFGVDQARRALEMIGADALIIHLNPLQEAVQPEGDRDWRGLLGKIGALARALEVPIVVKEVGCGISGALARRLVEAGVAVIDVAGAGGTSWAAVEAERAQTPEQAAIARAFVDWGQSTTAAIAAVRSADVVGQAAGILDAATKSADAVISQLSVVIAQLRIVCFCTGSSDLAALRHAPLALDGTAGR